MICERVLAFCECTHTHLPNPLTWSPGSVSPQATTPTISRSPEVPTRALRIRPRRPLDSMIAARAVYQNLKAKLVTGVVGIDRRIDIGAGVDHVVVNRQDNVTGLGPARAAGESDAPGFAPCGASLLSAPASALVTSTTSAPSQALPSCAEATPRAKSRTKMSLRPSLRFNLGFANVCQVQTSPGPSPRHRRFRSRVLVLPQAAPCPRPAAFGPARDTCQDG
jgi:hypothetical protein